MTKNTLRVAIAGVTGRMGKNLVLSVREAGYALVGGTSRADSPIADVRIASDLSELIANVDVVIDFTHVSTVVRHAEIVSEARVAWVLGTTGLSAIDQAAVVVAGERAPVVQAANFSPGVTLVERLARQMGAALPAETYDAEIVEMHHRQKVDAPSGTALSIGAAVAAGRGVTLDAVREPAREGHCGARSTGGIGFAALRGGQIVGEHTALFTSAREQIGLTHRAFDRRVFSDGAVMAAAWAAKQAAGLYSMEHVLGLI
ncbi:4-hydroxy-tetrahydrodipicolinate reductase [Acetobacter sp. DsW_063]|uniref:4-hydroxy-tetrahydrodipicolinate reductase n=1 Tax=Acetobacter sp. DsW_063 TaxID=1514894 RepID=UPI000A389ADA|nr:4-hydroxy-tetrahydrodipicolinate reductase [Acetobacter sp. DsW_063]OUJ16457.1 dihydrodipicolinate reductase [Acetobacter sp. DsW_063]